MKFPGLNPSLSYQVRILTEVGAPRTLQIKDIQWGDGVVLTGEALASIGIQPPSLAPENGILISIVKG